MQLKLERNMRLKALALVSIAMTSCTGNGDIRTKFTEEQKESLHVEEAADGIVKTDCIETIDCHEFLRDKEFAYLDLMDTVFFVTLDDKQSESLLGNVREVEVTDSLIYIEDQSAVKNIAIFRIDGSFVKRLKIGPGPGEIKRMYDFDIDPKNGDLVVYQTGMLDRYTCYGEYKESEKVPLAFQEFMMTDSGYIFYQEYEMANEHLGKHRNKGVLMTDRKFRLISSATEIKPPVHLGKSTKNLFRTGDEITVTRPFTDTIYSIGAEGAKAKVKIEYGNEKFDTELLYREKKPMKVLAAHSSEYRFMGDYMETSTHQCVFLKNSGGAIIYRDKKSGNTIGGTQITLNTEGNVIDAPVIDFPRWCTKEYFVECRDIRYGIPFSTKYISKEDSIKASKLTEESNPTLVFYKMKHF